MAPSVKRLPAAFYRGASGSEPVRDWLKDLAPEDRKAIGEDIRTAELGWPLGMPVCRPVSGRKGLWEIRSNLPGGGIARVLCAVEAGHLVLLHGFIKKSRKAPLHELDLAERRLKELRR